MPQTARITLQIVGSIKHAIYHEPVSDPDGEAIGDIIHWSWSTRLQAKRFGQSLRETFAAMQEGGGLHLRRCFSSTNCDAHILLVVSANLDRALDRAPSLVGREAELPTSPRRAIRLLRNIYEHWNEHRAAIQSSNEQVSRSLALLRAEFPQADPWTFTFNPVDGAVVMADVIPLTPLMKELRLLEARMLRIERQRRRGRLLTPGR